MTLRLEKVFVERDDTQGHPSTFHGLNGRNDPTGFHKLIQSRTVMDIAIVDDLKVINGISHGEIELWL